MKPPRLIRKTTLIFTLSLITYIATKVVIGNINNYLHIQIQSTEHIIDTLNKENDNLESQIISLQARDRVYALAYDYGLNSNLENILVITKE